MIATQVRFTRPAQSLNLRRLRAPLAVAACLRLGLMLLAFALTGTRIMTQGDTSSYIDPGRSLFFHGAFATLGAPEIDRTPGYPIFAVFTGMAFDNVLLTVTAQILIALASLILVARIAERIFPSHGVRPNRSVGLFAAWLFAFEPLMLTSAIRLMPETLFVLLLLFAVERILSFLETRNLIQLAFAGVLLASATFVRPVSYYLGFALAIGLAIASPKQRGLRWNAPAILLLGILPWLAAWQLRNKIETGYSGFSSIVEENLYFFQSAEVTAEMRHISLGAEQKELGYPDDLSYIAMHPEQRDWSRSQKLRFMRRQSLQILSQHPLLYLKTHIRGVAIVAFTPCATEMLQLLDAYPPPDTMPRRILNEGLTKSLLRVLTAHPGVSIAMAAFEAWLLMLYALAAYGIFHAKKTDASVLLLLGIALYFLLISGGAQAIGRYRAPVMPELCIFAAAGLVALRTKRNAKP